METQSSKVPKFGTGYPTGWGAVRAEPEPGTRNRADTGIRVPGYPGYHTLFAPLFAFDQRRRKADTSTRVPGLPCTISSPCSF